MMLATLIQKGGLRQIANAISATDATKEKNCGVTVAKIAGLAVAIPMYERNANDWQEKFDECAAIIEYGAAIPRDWAEAFARVCLMQRPANISEQGWQRIIDNSGRLLDNKNHLRDMVRYGWTVDDIFGVDESATEKWQGAKGLLLMLDDNEVTSIASEYVIDLRHSYSGDVLHYTKPPSPSANQWVLQGVSVHNSTILQGLSAASL